MKSKNPPSDNVQNPELNGSYCGKDGICSHEVLRREDSTSELLSLLDEKKTLTKV